MRAVLTILAFGMVAGSGWAQTGSGTGPYRILQTQTVGGEGGFDYVYADTVNRKLYAPRGGQAGHLSVFDLDTLKPVGDLPEISAHGAAVDLASGHGFGSSKPGGDVGREDAGSD